MEFEIFTDSVLFRIEHPKKIDPAQRPIAKNNLKISDDELALLCNKICLKDSASQSVHTSSQYLNSFIKPLLRYLEKSQLTALPTTALEWQVLVFDFFRFVLTDFEYSKAGVKTRVSMWQSTITNCLNFLKDEDVIPTDVFIPNVERKVQVADGQNKPLLGVKPVADAPQNEPVKKLLVDTSYSQPDAAFLDHIEAKCRERVEVLRECCIEHFTAMKADHVAGESLAGEINDELFDYELNNNFLRVRNNSGEITRSSRYLSSPSRKNGANWAIASVKRYIINGEPNIALTGVALSQSPYFGGRQQVIPVYPSLISLTAANEQVIKGLSNIYLILRFAGVLLPVDVAALCALIATEHPKFNPESIHSAKLLDVKGNPYLIVGDGGSIFSVDKPRAGKRKVEALSELTKEVIQHVIHITSPIRKVLKDNNDKRWRFLFLGLSKKSVGVVSFEGALTPDRANNRITFMGLYPKLNEYGIEADNLSLSSIRNTMGVLRWFESGSIIEMSQTLGNSQKVVLKHYLPPVLLAAWNTRIIRRFQQTLLILALHEEDYLLEVSDFSDIGELLYFMAQLAFEYKIFGSPVANEISTRIGTRFDPNAKSNGEREPVICDGVVNIKLSVNSLGFVYAFQDFAENLDVEQRAAVDPSTNLSPQYFIDVARMIKHACESNENTSRLNEIIDTAQLKVLHSEALVKSESLRGQFNSFEVKNEWCN